MIVLLPRQVLVLRIGNHKSVAVVACGGHVLANRPGKSVAPGRGVRLTLVGDVTLIKIYSALPLENHYICQPTFNQGDAGPPPQSEGRQRHCRREPSSRDPNLSAVSQAVSH